MKLATRLSAFFLAALSVILIANSVLLFAVARFYLYRQFDEQLAGTLHTLVAAIEVEDDDVKWEPSDHTVTLGTGNEVDDIRWAVLNDRGMLVDRSRNLQGSSQDLNVMKQAVHDRDAASSPEWQILTHRLAAPYPKVVELRTPLEHEALTVVVGRRLSIVRANLRWLAFLLVTLPTACWLVSALGGRWFCQKAIAPVSKMSLSANRIGMDDTAERLPVAASGDELEELGVAFNRLLDQLFVAYERQRRFASDAAHQLRTPLTVLQGQVEVDLRRPRTNNEYEKTLRIVEEEVASFRQTVDSLLFLAAPQSDSFAPDIRTFEVGPWIENYVRRWQSHPRAADIATAVAANPTCHSSPALLAQLLDVLVSNAMKYSSAGSAITVKASNANQSLVIEVEDQGIGVRAEDLDGIFQPFFRTREARQRGTAGSGLGLSIAARIATALGGTLRCLSEHGRGSRFVFTLPRTANSDSASAPATQTFA